MYKVVNKTFSNYDAADYGQPIVCLEDEWGGQSVIAIDDRCYVLLNGSDSSHFRMVTHWHPEAMTALLNYLLFNYLGEENEGQLPLPKGRGLHSDM